MSNKYRRKVIRVLPHDGPPYSGPTEYQLECGHRHLAYPKVKPAAVGIQVTHPKTATCWQCKEDEA